MIQGLYSMIASMRAQQYNIDVISNNIANLDSIAFKSERAEFADALYDPFSAGQLTGAYMQQGCGGLAGSLQRNMMAGVPYSTGLSTDFMLQVDGYFAVQGPQGVCYTRDGDFKVSAESTGNYLVTSNGYYVLDSNNQRIQISGDVSTVTADAAGNLYQGDTKFATFKLSSFTNEQGLQNIGGNMVVPTAQSGAAQASGATVAQGWLEGSNVDLANEMTQLMAAQKAYAVFGTAMQTADQMESLANSMYK